VAKVTNSIKYGGGSVTFITMKAIIGFHCNICGEEIEQGDKMNVVIPNKSQFPNARVHHKCTVMPPSWKGGSPFDKNNPLVWTAGQLAKSWAEAQRYRHWFLNDEV